MKNLQTTNYKLQTNQAGVTLLLAILIMSGLTVITLAIGSLAIQEIRSSRAIVVSEPAIAAAESGGEQGLWAIKRNGTVPSCDETPNTQTLANYTYVNSCQSFGKATFSVRGGTPFTFYLYDPDNIYGDVDLLSMANAYNSLTITQISGSYQVNASVLRWNGTSTGITPSSSVVTPGATQTVSIAPVPTGTEGRLKVTLTATGDVSVEVNTNAGMPTFPTLDSTGCSAKGPVTGCDTNNQEIFSRRINITVPQ